MTYLIEFTKPKFEALKKAYQSAIDNDHDQFEYDNQTYVTDYAKYVIEYLEPKFTNSITQNS